MTYDIVYDNDSGRWIAFDMSINDMAKSVICSGSTKERCRAIVDAVGYRCYIGE